jgi:MFS family permease
MTSRLDLSWLPAPGARTDASPGQRAAVATATRGGAARPDSRGDAAPPDSRGDGAPPDTRGDGAPPDTRGEHAAPPARLTGVGLATLLIGALLPMVDFFIVNVALPSIDADLHASAPLLELVVSGYASAYALMLVMGGRLGDSFGRRRLFLAGMAGFTLTSLACGLAPSAELLVTGRALQGASAAMMVPQVLATIQAATSGEQRSRALGRYGATGGIAAVIGQLFGGFLVSANIDGLTWRPIFLVNVPIGLAGLVLARRYVPATRADRAARVDIPGTALLAALVLALLLPLTEGRATGWPAWTIAALAAAPLLAAGFGLVEVTKERAGRLPLVPPSLLRQASMRRGLAIAWIFFAGFGAFMFCYALIVQRGLRESALAAGAGLVPMGITFLLASLATSRLLARFGTRVLVTGALLQAAGLVIIGGTVLASWPAVSVVALAPGMAVAGFGQGLVMSPLMGVVLADVPRSAAGVGGGVFVTTQQTGLALGVATLGTLFLTLAGDSTGVQDGFLVVLCVQAVVALIVAAGAARLPDPRRGRSGAPAGERDRANGPFARLNPARSDDY